MNLSQNFDKLQEIIYDVRDESAVHHAVIDDRLERLESMLCEINGMLKQLLFEKDHSI